MLQTIGKDVKDIIKGKRYCGYIGKKNYIAILTSYARK